MLETGRGRYRRGVAPRNESVNFRTYPVVIAALDKAWREHKLGVSRSDVVEIACDEFLRRNGLYDGLTPAEATEDQGGA